MISKEGTKHRYEKIKKLGQGSYGSVTKVFDHESEKTRALKKIKFTAQDDGIPINAIRQISILKRIDHHHIIRYLNLNIEESMTYIIIGNHLNYISYQNMLMKICMNI